MRCEQVHKNNKNTVEFRVELFLRENICHKEVTDVIV